MIEKLRNNELDISEKIRSVFQLSYKIEAKLLNAFDNFPPLNRPLEDYLDSNSEFFGYWKDEELAGVIEICHGDNYKHIRSLVVNPLYFRQKIASELIEFVLNRFDTNLFIVETGLGNKPASKLYEKYGFKEIKQWDTDHGVRKVKFEKRIIN